MSMVGKLVCSVAGHDSGTMYVCVGCNDTGILVADGKIKTILAPKVKNRKHIRIENANIKSDTLDAVNTKHATANELIRRDIKLYCKGEL